MTRATEDKPSMTQGERRVFTVRQANQAIPRVSRLMKSLRDQFRWLDGNRQTVPYLLAEYNVVNEAPVDSRYFRALLSVRGTIRQVEKLGAQIKDVNTGLVDFPGRIYGRDVLLCWMLGEAEIRFYHDPETGFAGRQPIPDTSETTGNNEEGS